MSEQEISCDANEPEMNQDIEEKRVVTESLGENPADINGEEISKNEIQADSVEELPQNAVDNPVTIAEDNDIPQYSSDENESFDSSSSDSSSSSDESDGEVDEERPVLEEEEAYTGPIVSKNEVNDDVIPEVPADFEMTEKTPIQHIGEIMGHAEHTLLIKASVSGEERVLDEKSILCLEDRTILGLLYETFGKLESPIYVVRFKDDEDLKKFSQQKGAKVFFVVNQSKFVNTKALRTIKGTDASNCHDEELPEEEQEFSDDEKELLFKQARKRSKKGPRKNANTEQETGAQSNLYSQLKALPSRSTVPSSAQSQDSHTFARNDPVSRHQQQNYSPAQTHNSMYSHPMIPPGVQYNTSGMAQYSSEGMGQYNNQVMGSYNTQPMAHNPGLDQYNPGMAQYNPGMAQYNPGMAQYNPGMTQYNNPGMTQFNNFQQPNQHFQGYPAPANNLTQAQLLYLQQAMFQQMAGQNPQPQNHYGDPQNSQNQQNQNQQYQNQNQQNQNQHQQNQNQNQQNQPRQYPQGDMY